MQLVSSSIIDLVPVMTRVQYSVSHVSYQHSNVHVDIHTPCFSTQRIHKAIDRVEPMGLCDGVRTVHQKHGKRDALVGTQPPSVRHGMNQRSSSYIANCNSWCTVFSRASDGIFATILANQRHCAMHDNDLKLQ